MTVDERRKCLKRMQRRYLAATREERSRLLDELAELTGLHRKSVVRLLKGPSLDRQPRVQQRGREYGPAVDDALRVIWESLDYVCAERLTPGLVPTAQLLAQHGELRLTPELERNSGRSASPRCSATSPGWRRTRRGSRAKGPRRPTGWRGRSRCGGFLGTSGSRATSRSIWCITAGRPPRGSTSTRCSSSTWRRAGVS